MGATDSELRDIYTRVNKYNVRLNAQELRRADYPGAFLDVSESLSLVPLLETGGVFSAADRRRMNDVEFTSELLAAQLSGPQDKKDSLSGFYKSYSVWEEDARAACIAKFSRNLEIIDEIFEGTLKQTRFCQRADFYALFSAVNAVADEGGTVAGKDLSTLREDFRQLDEGIEPSSRVRAYSSYAVRCVSDANSQASRRWRAAFLTHFLRGTLLAERPSPVRVRLFLDMQYDADDRQCPPAPCELCRDEPDLDGSCLAWDTSFEEYQFSNRILVHLQCPELENHTDIIVIEASGEFPY